MKLSLWKRSIQNRYSQLLGTIIILFIAAPIFSGAAGRIIFGAILSITIVSIIRTLDLPRHKFFFLLALAGASFTLDIHNTLRPDLQEYEFYILYILLVQIIYSIFLLTALITINKKIFLVNQVDADTIKGGIAVFFLIGILWAIFYTMVFTLDPNAFSQSIEPLEVLDSMFYFSFTTLTTLGYGDISPVSEAARTLANFEAIVGVMYPAIYIARVVGIYTAQEMSNHD